MSYLSVQVKAEVCNETVGLVSQCDLPVVDLDRAPTVLSQKLLDLVLQITVS